MKDQEIDMKNRNLNEYIKQNLKPTSSFSPTSPPPPISKPKHDIKNLGATTYCNIAATDNQHQDVIKVVKNCPPRLREILIETGDFHYTSEFIKEDDLTTDYWKNIFLTFEIGGSPYQGKKQVGYVNIEITHLTTLVFANINIAIEAEYRNQKIGYQLIQRAILECKKIGLDLISVSIAKNNIPSQRLFASCGFVKHGVAPQYVEDGKIIVYDRFILYLREVRE